MKDNNIGTTVVKKEFFRAIVVDLGGSGKELMKKIRKSRKIVENVREKVKRKERIGRRKMVSSCGKDRFMC